MPDGFLMAGNTAVIFVSVSGVKIVSGSSDGEGGNTAGVESFRAVVMAASCGSLPQASNNKQHTIMARITLL
jgi:hypothetical protein